MLHPYPKVQGLKIHGVVKGVMMKLTLSTPHHALRNVAKGPITRPNNFMMIPQIQRFGQRARIVANWPLIYIGKESDKRWEEGEDLSLLEFKSIEYKRKGSAIATDEQLERIANIPKREFMRRGVNQHTLEKICKRQPVRVAKLLRCLKALEQYENETAKDVHGCITNNR